MFTSAELEQMIRATGGVAVVYGGTTTYGHRELVGEVVLQDGAEVEAEIDTVRVATGILSGLAQGAAITVGGESLVIGEYRRVGDGLETLIELEEP